jgi:hypothetical protein
LRVSRGGEGNVCGNRRSGAGIKADKDTRRSVFRAARDNETTPEPKKCECPAPKAHDGACTCEGVDCDCRELPIMDTVHLGEKEITVEDQTGWFTPEVKSKVETFLDMLNNSSIPEEVSTVSDIKGRSSLKIVIKQIDNDYNIVGPIEFEIDVDVLNNGTINSIGSTIIYAFDDLYIGLVQ